ncbi:dUTP diphosphatase [Bacillus smithii]|uniref:dUTP diphosphatase n=1 Tax=Bacillus smithii TaxID=1479 RepID=UPI003D221737
MNLKKLFDMQKKLDEKILERFPHLRNEDLLPKKILALQVELGELCNCWRGFKFWSNDQAPRTRITKADIEYFDKTGKVRWKENNPLLEEFVDVLHFLLSIGLELNVDPTEIRGIYERGSLIEQFNAVFDCVSRFWNRVDRGFSYEEQVEWYVWTFKGFIVLGHMLGFSWDQIEQAYMKKNAENHARQANGY